MKSRRLKRKLAAFLLGIGGSVSYKIAEDNLPPFTFKNIGEFCVYLWNGIFPTLTHLFFASWFVLGVFGIQYVVMHSRSFFEQLSILLLMAAALLMVYLLSKSKDPKERMMAIGFSLVLVFAIGFIASIKAQRTLNQ